MTIDPTTARLVHTISGAADLAVERNHTYPNTRGPLPFELYRPAEAASRCQH